MRDRRIAPELLSKPSWERTNKIIERVKKNDYLLSGRPAT
jgi:hypothetical protein